MELVEPWVQERERNAEIKGEQVGLRKGIRGTVDVLQSLGHSNEEIKIIIMEKYDLSEKEAKEYL